MHTADDTSKLISDRKLIITADDFGAAKNINEGTILAAGKGAITEISALSNFKDCLPELKMVSDSFPDIGIGVHLNIEAGKPVLAPEVVPSLVDNEGYFYTLDNILEHIPDMALDELRMELKAQVSLLVDNGIPVDHLSDHCGIISLYTPFSDVMIELALQYDIPVRSPVLASSEFPRNYKKSTMKKNAVRMLCKLAIKSPPKAISLLKYCSKKEMARKHEYLKEVGIRHTDYLIECFWGEPSFDYFKQIVETLPDGTTELIVHLGTDTRLEPFPRGIDIEYFDSREIELDVVTSQDARNLLQSENIRLIGFSDLKGAELK